MEAIDYLSISLPQDLILLLKGRNMRFINFNIRQCQAVKCFRRMRIR